MSTLLFEDKIPANGPAFAARVREISTALGIDPNWLMGSMFFESKLNHKVQNPSTKATGLIQFMPRTAINLGTTTDALVAMSNVQQLDYVYKYFKPATGKLKTWFDLYLWVFFPVAIGKADSYVLATPNIPAATIARQNPVFDLNKDGKVTKAEVRAGYLKALPAPYQAYLSTEKKST
jgi:hypothetical protein